MSINEFEMVVHQVSQILEEMGIENGIVGSVASSKFGENRATNDIDIVVTLSRKQIRPLVEAMKTDFYIDPEMIAEALERNSSFNAVHLETGIKLDFFTQKPREYDRVALQRRTATIPAFMRVEDVLLGKLEWYKATDCTSEKQWRDILGLLRFNPDLDLEYSKHWAAQIDVLDLLEQAISAANIF